MPSTSKRSFPVRRPFVLALPAPAPGFVMTPGRNCSKPLEVPAIQRQGVNRRVAHGAAQSRIGGVDFRNFAGNRDGLGLFAGLDRQVHANRLADLDQAHRCARTFRKPLASARTVYVPGSKLGATYSPAAIGGKGSRDAARHVDYRDRWRRQ